MYLLLKWLSAHCLFLFGPHVIYKKCIHEKSFFFSCIFEYLIRVKLLIIKIIDNIIFVGIDMFEFVLKQFSINLKVKKFIFSYEV